MFGKIFKQIKAFLLLPSYLNAHIIEMNRIEDSIKYQISFVTDVQQEVNIIKGILEYQNKLLVEINDKLDKIERRLK